MTARGTFKVDVFDCQVHIIIAKSVKSSVNYHLRKHGQELITFEPSGYFCKPDADRIGNYYVFLSEEDLSVDIYHHEQSHLVEQILIDRDIKPVDEVRAYLTGYVSRMFDRFFKARKIKLRNKR
jgi:hypothetical protein